MEHSKHTPASLRVKRRLAFVLMHVGSLVLATACQPLVYDSTTLAKLVNTTDEAQAPLRSMVLGTTEEQRWEFKNTGSIYAKITGHTELAATAIFRYKGGVFPGTGGTCDENLEPGQSCVVYTEFKPLTEGVYSPKWILSYGDGATTVQLPFLMQRLVGTPAVLEVLEGGEYSFPVTELGGATRKTFTIKNTGGLEASAMTSAMTGGTHFQIERSAGAGTCGNTLPSQATCTLTLIFQPQAQGSHNDILTLTYNNMDGSGTTSTVVRGISAQIAANVSFVGNPSYVFGTAALGKSLLKKVVLTNNGFVNASDFHFVDDGSFSVIATTCTSTLAIAASCEATIRFLPTTLGVLSGHILARYESGQGPMESSFAVEGTGLNPARIVVKLDPTTPLTDYDFGTQGVGDQIDGTLYLHNIGQAYAETLSLTVDAASPFSITASYCPPRLAPAVTCEIRLRFRPTALQLYDVPLNIHYDDGVAPGVDAFPLKGEGTSRGVLRFDQAPSIGMGSLVVGNHSDFSITIRNHGLGTATILALPSLPTDVSLTGGTWPGSGGTCGALPLAMVPGSSCSLRLRFAPSGENSYYGSIGLSYDNELTTIVQTMTLYGTGIADASLTVLTAQPHDLGPVSSHSSKIFTVSIQNTGGVAATNIDANFTGHSGFRFSGGSFPGINPLQDTELGASDTSYYCSTTLNSQASCNLYLELQTGSVESIASTLSLDYEGETGNYSASLNLQAEAKSLGQLSVSPLIFGAFEFPLVAHGIVFDKTMTLTNTGSANLSIGDVGALADPVTIVDAASCLSTLAPAQTCDLTVRFSPTTVGSHFKSFDIDYYDGEIARTISQSVRANSTSPATISINPSLDYDYGLVVVGSTRSVFYTLRNTGGVPATSIAFTPPLGNFSISSNDCPSTLDTSDQCTLRVDFLPTVAGTEVSSAFSVAYHNGVTGVSHSRNVRGTGEPPLHIHRGWTKIFAVGDAVDTRNISQSDRRVELAWNAMTPNSSTISSYSVFRRLSTDTYDFNSPVGAGISTTGRSFTDTNVVSGTVYYYTVKPIIDNYPSRSTASFAEIRVVTPPANMALIHRSMANKAICDLMQKPVDLLNFNRCSYTSIGNRAGYMDVGYDYMVDRFELGVDQTSRSGQLPDAGRTQIEANAACKLQDGIPISGIGSKTFTKGLLSRKEHLIAALWPTSLTAVEIVAIQEGSLGSQNCNGDSTSLDLSGNNPTCTSRWGVEDMAGNAWEWVSDRIYDGKGISLDSLKLDTTNTDLDNVSFLNLQSASYLSGQSCLAPALMLPVYSTSGTCATDTFSPTDFGAANLLNGRYYAPGNMGARFIAVGGSFIKSSTYPSIFTTAFLDPNLPVGAARCGFRLN